MRYRRESEPSPFRTGLVHAGFSLTVFGGLAACFGLGVHLLGDPAKASPRKTIALFGPADRTYAFADATPYGFAGGVLPAPGEEIIPARYEDDPDTGFALTYTNLEGDGLRIDVTGGQGGPVPGVTDAGVRINGRLVQPGQSFGEVRASPSGALAGATSTLAVNTAPSSPDTAGRAPAEAYARPFSNPEGRPMVALVIGGLGINATQTLLAIETLPPEVTLSFAPDTSRLDYWIRIARQAGHEVLIELPMEAQAYDRMEMRRDTLLAAAPPQANLQRLNRLLGRANGYFGVINYQGAKFAADPGAVEPVFKALAERGLAFIDDGTLESSAFAGVASGQGLRFVRAAGPVDTRQTHQEIASELMEIETQALQRGAALGAAFAFPVTIEAASNWIEQLPERGLVLAPASALLPRTPARPAPAALGRESRTGSLRGSGLDSGG
jgi:polysaccharide deacetylase 2 family uncharacterized protein YibQ